MQTRWAAIVFVTVAFGVPWLGWSLKAMLHLPWNFWGKLAFYSGSAASVGGLLAVYLCEGRAGVRDRLKRAVAWRVPLRWWAFALCLPVVWTVGFAGIQHFRAPGSVSAFDPAVLGNWLQWSTLLLLIPPPGEDFA